MKHFCDSVFLQKLSKFAKIGAAKINVTKIEVTEINTFKCDTLSYPPNIILEVRLELVPLQLDRVATNLNRNHFTIVWLQN